uniref:Neurotransmitter-gated ion-channel ligand-binding domain-containing protein n=1 Tax=Meloidogyne incognita TaxID=6306 RepID=A0A914N1Y7_MELIC
MLILTTLIPLIFIPQFTSNKISRKNYEAQLYEDLLFDYNRISRPVKNSTDVLHIDVGASLIRQKLKNKILIKKYILESSMLLDEKNQVLTTNLWLEMRWSDARLQWDPNKYGAHIYGYPIFVLYDNAAGDPDITIFTDALISYNGRVYWQPPAIYKSFCPIKVKWFPYDKQDCRMKFGAWSYTGNYVDLHLIQQENSENINNRVNLNKKREEDDDIEYNEMGMDLSFFYKSAEWDLMNLTSARHAVLYTSCCGPETYVDITYYLELRRK